MIIMKWTQTDIIRPSFAKCNEIGYHIYNSSSILNTFYCNLVNHIFDTKIVILIVNFTFLGK